MRAYLLLLAVAAAAQPLPPITIAPDSPEARAARVEGTANAWADIDRDGKVVDAGLLQGLGMGLDNQTVDTVRKTRFPAQTTPGVAAIDVVYALPSGPHWRIARLIHRFSAAEQQHDPTTHKAPSLTNPVLRQYTRPEDRACADGAAFPITFSLSSAGVPGDIEGAGAPTDAIRAWRFEPARRNGEPVAVTSEVLLLCAEPVENAPPIYRVGGGVTAPRLVLKAEPVYSEEARMNKFQGTVVLDLRISPYGYAENMRVRRPLGQGLDIRALDAVRQWKFAPGLRGGSPVSVQATIEVNFRLL